MDFGPYVDADGTDIDYLMRTPAKHQGNMDAVQQSRSNQPSSSQTGGGQIGTGGQRGTGGYQTTTNVTSYRHSVTAKSNSSGYQPHLIVTTAGYNSQFQTPASVTSAGFKPQISGYHPPVSGGYNPQVSVGYQPPVSVGYQPKVSSGYQPPVSVGYQPHVSAGYQPPVSVGYQPPVSVGYQPPVSVGYQPHVSAGYKPSLSSGYQPGTQTNLGFNSMKNGYQPANNVGLNPSGSMGSEFRPRDNVDAGRKPSDNEGFQPFNSIGEKSDNVIYEPLSPMRVDVDSEHDMTSTFFEFPKTRPFINSNYRQAVNKPPVIPYPESNRDGIYSAMKNLQDKVQRLELERTTAEDNLKNLSNETAKYSLCLQKSQETENLANEIVNKQTKEIEKQLSSAESRCGTLEKQLDYMRKMLHTSQQEQLESARKRLEHDKHRHYPPPPSTDPNLQHQLKKIPELERENLKLSATQTISEKKIRELEEKLREEDIHRKMIMDRANDLQARAKAVYSSPPNNYNGLDEHPIKLSDRPKTKKIMKKKKKKPGNDPKQPHKSCSKHYDPSSHYRLNLNEIPFVAGTATTPSHSVGANIQKVISMMKAHNLALCSSMYNHGGRSGSVSSTSSTTSLDSDMTEILQQLQDEFGQLSFEHKELSNQIEETSDYGVRRDFKRELDRVVRRLETKSQQISKVRAHQQKLSEMKRKVKNRKREHLVKKSLPLRPASARERTPTKPSLSKQTLNKPTSPRSVAARNVLNDMKKIQTTLRKDDLKWE